MKSSIILCLAISIFSLRVSCQEEARAAWEVTKFDVTATINHSDRSLTSRALLTAKNVGQGAGRTLTIRLNPQAEIRSATLSGTTLEFRSQPESRTNLQRATLVLRDPVEPQAVVQITLDYRLPVTENSAILSISPGLSQFLPLSYWYPSPNTYFSLRSADVAPVRLTVTSSGEQVISAGKLEGNIFNSSVYSQPFFLTGNWDTREGSADASGITAYLFKGAGEEERKRADRLISLAASARSYYTTLLGTAPDLPIKLVSVSKGAGFNHSGVILLETSSFRRSKLDSNTALSIAEGVARAWIGAQTPVRGEGQGVLQEGLLRYLASLFLEKEFGANSLESLRIRNRLAYAAIANRDGPLSQSSPIYDTHFNAVSNKGSMVWRVVEATMGREAFVSLIRSQLQGSRTGGFLLSNFRAALVQSQVQAALLEYLLDQPTGMDLMIGAPQQKGVEWVAALRNTGAHEAKVNVLGITETGQRLNTVATIPATDFAEARFKSNAKIVRVEVDPEKLYPQIDYSNDHFPRTSSPEESSVEAIRHFTRQEFTKAESLAREAITVAPRMQEARITLARSLLAQSKIDQAQVEFQNALNESLPTPPTLAWANIGLAEISIRKNQFPEAVTRYDEAVRADAEYAATLNARLGRIKAEVASNRLAPIDEAAKTLISQFDSAVRSGRKAEIEALVVPGELGSFIKGVVGNQPESWQTKVVRTERIGTSRIVADVSITAKTWGKDQSGTAVFIMDQTNSGWKLSAIELFEVR
jgi:tetratricopeptide (TPR) repeat protein